MHFRSVIVVGAVFCVVMAGTLADAELITYRDVIEAAIRSSAGLKVKEQDIKIAHAAYRQAFAGLYPELTLTGRLERYENLDKDTRDIQSVNSEVVGGQSSWRSLAYLSGQYEISSWYKKRYEASYYQKLRDAAVFDCSTESKKLARDMTDLFGRLAEGKVRLRYGGEIIKALQDLVDLRNQSLAGGEASREEVIKAESDLESAEREQATLMKELRENLEALNSYTAKSYAATDEIESLNAETDHEAAEPTMHQIEDAPELKARRKELEALQLKAKSTFNNYLPDVSMYGRYDYYGSDTDSMDNALREIRESGYNAGILISLPIFDGGARKWERVKTGEEIKKQEESIRAAIEERKRELRTSYAGYTELSRALTHYRKLAEQYEKLRVISGKAAALGQRSRADLLEMERDYLQIVRDLKVTETTLGVYQKRLAIESDYGSFMREFYGNGSCQY
ncbi:MAG TPA: TolC family protein [Syntrophales bacterium]|nr:TolC family protein [Syntrophales bacterium]HPX56539.1 TolC family protein [Syntrophales bacterium]